MRNKILCPIINKQITFDECFDCAMVAEGAPSWTGVKEIVEKPNFEKICMKCINHLD